MRHQGRDKAKASNLSSGRHLTSKEAAELVGSLDHRPIASKISLGAQYIEGLNDMKGLKVRLKASNKCCYLTTRQGSGNAVHG